MTLPSLPVEYSIEEIYRVAEEYAKMMEDLYERHTEVATLYLSILQPTEYTYNKIQLNCLFYVEISYDCENSFVEFKVSQYRSGELVEREFALKYDVVYSENWEEEVKAELALRMLKK